MLFFRYNKGSRPINHEDIDKNPLIKFFKDRNPEEIIRLAQEISPDAQQLFDGSMQSMLGALPEEIAETTITMDKSALQQILFSSMMTGYLAKTLENKIELEKCWNADIKDNNELLLEKELKEINNDDDDLKGIL